MNVCGRLKITEPLEISAGPRAKSLDDTVVLVLRCDTLDGYGGTVDVQNFACHNGPFQVTAPVRGPIGLDVFHNVQLLCHGHHVVPNDPANGPDALVNSVPRYGDEVEILSARAGHPTMP